MEASIAERPKRGHGGHSSTHYSKFNESKFFNNLETTVSFNRIKHLRPLTFALSIPKTQDILHSDIEKFETIHYLTKHFNTNEILGIRSDLFALGFDFKKMKSLFSSQTLLKESIELLLNDDPKEQGILSRKDELEILEAFFE